MKSSERPSRFWIGWIFFGLLLPLLAVFLRTRFLTQPPDANTSNGPSVKHVVVDGRTQREVRVIPENEGEMADSVLEEILEDALTIEKSGSETFLATDYEPLSKWLDQRFEIDMISMTPLQIFDLVPLNDIVYELKLGSTRDAKANFQAANISRRELLKRISEQWDLHLEIKNGNDGRPIAVEVSRR